MHGKFCLFNEPLRRFSSCDINEFHSKASALASKRKLIKFSVTTTLIHEIIELTSLTKRVNLRSWFIDVESSRSLGCDEIFYVFCRQRVVKLTSFIHRKQLTHASHTTYDKWIFISFEYFSNEILTRFRATMFKCLWQEDINKNVFEMEN